MNWRLYAAALLGAPLIAACGGGSDPTGDGIDKSTGLPVGASSLCTLPLDYSTVFTGGGGDGELAQLQLDTTNMTWQVTYLQSPIPASVNTVQPTRAGTVQSGTLTAETGLPTLELNRCAFRLNGASLDPNRPARVFVGEGVAGGTIPGKEISFGGVLGVGSVPDTTFPYYPFIGFASIETDLSKIAGTYNEIGYHEILSQNLKQVAVDSQVTIHSDGSWQSCDNLNPVQCFNGQPFGTLANGGGAFVTTKMPSQVAPTSAAGGPFGNGYLIVGKLRNQLVPILLRSGFANSSPVPVAQPGPNGTSTLIAGPVADDESGIAILAPQSAISVGSQNGEYIGVDSQFDYRSPLIEGAKATLLDPFNASQASLATALDMDFTQSTPGVVTTTHSDAAAGSASTGKFVFTGGVLGYLDMTTPSAPYFTIGAFVQ